MEIISAIPWLANLQHEVIGFDRITFVFDAFFKVEESIKIAAVYWKN